MNHLGEDQDECKKRRKRTIIVANAEPYKHIFQSKEISQLKVPGGLTTGLDPLMLDSDNLWIGWGRGDADFEVTDEDGKVKVPDEERGYTLKRIKLSKEEQDSFYYGFANNVLWPICHSFLRRAKIDEGYWECYKEINRRYAESVIQEMGERDRIWIHDYHLALVPKYIRDRRPDANIALFWHIPWPPWEIFGTLPWREDIVEGMVGADFIGFHTSWLCHNFYDSVMKLGGTVNVLENVVKINDETATVKNIPFGIDCRAYTPDREHIEGYRNLKEHYTGDKIVFSLDRLDYTKGIDKRLDAIEIFLRKYPEFEGEVTFIQRVTPSRGEVSEYRKKKKDIERKVSKINGLFQKKDWVPVRYFYQYLPQDDLIQYYLASDIALITPLIDGMNLVCKEYVCAREDGALILSQFAGAAEMLTEAIQVNPHDTEGVADAIYRALEMPEEERKDRFLKLKKKIQQMDIHWWRERFLDEWELSTYKS